MQIDAMSLAQIKRQLAWETEELRHLERDSQSASLALENAKKKVEEYKKKLVDAKRKIDQHTREVTMAEEDLRKRTFAARK